MKYLINKKRVTILIVAIVIVVFSLVFLKQDNKDKPLLKMNSPLFKLQENTEKNIVVLSGFVKPIEEISLASESSGIIEEIFISEGENVKRGQKIVQIENINQKLALKNAQVSYESAKLQLEKMKQNNNTEDISSGISRVSENQESVLASAKNSYLNTDLRAYPHDFDEDKIAPIVSGNYSCEEEGEYHIEVYSSNGPEGASFNIEGLETGRQTVSINYPVSLGSCGLEIVFNEDFSKNGEWIIPVPNTRSPQAIQAKKQYETALSGKELVLKQSRIDIKDIQYQEKLVSQAALGVEAARIALDKTTIVSPVDGKFEELYVDIGNLVSPGKNIGRIISQDFEFVVDMPAYQRSQLSLNQTGQLVIDDKEYEASLNSFVDDSRSLSQNKTVKFSFTNEDEFIGGEIGKVSLELDQIFYRIPREFVGFGYYGAFIVCDDEERFVRIYEEDEDFYWVDFNTNVCVGEISLPHLDV